MQTQTRKLLVGRSSIQLLKTTGENMARIKMKSNRQKAWEHETRKSEVIAKRQSLTKASPAREELEEYDSGFESDEDLKVKGKLLACVKNAGAGTCVSHKSMTRADEQRQKVLTQLRRRDIKRDVRTKTGFREGEDHVEDDGLNHADQYNDYDEPLSSKRKVHLLCSCFVPLLLLCVFVV